MKDATASSCPNAGIASTGTKLPLIASGEMLPKTLKFAVVIGVGVALGCAYIVAVKPGNTFVGRAMISSFVEVVKNLLSYQVGISSVQSKITCPSFSSLSYVL